jgi:hypothetical protein
MNAMPAARAIMLVALIVFLGAGCDSDNNRDKAIQTQKDKEDAEVRGNAEKMAAKAAKLEADITNYNESLADWEGKRTEANANAKAAYDRGTGVGSHIDYAARFTGDVIKGALTYGMSVVGSDHYVENSQAGREAANAKHWLNERDGADREIADCKGKLNETRSELNRTRQWMTEASNTSAKNAADTSRQVVRPPVVMPPAAGCAGRR